MLSSSGAEIDGEQRRALEAKRGDHAFGCIGRIAVQGDRETPLPGDHRICKVGRTRGTVCSAVLAVPKDAAAPVVFRFAAGPAFGVTRGSDPIVLKLQVEYEFSGYGGVSSPRAPVTN